MAKNTRRGQSGRSYGRAAAAADRFHRQLQKEKQTCYSTISKLCNRTTISPSAKKKSRLRAIISSEDMKSQLHLKTQRQVRWPSFLVVFFIIILRSSSCTCDEPCSSFFFATTETFKHTREIEKKWRAIMQPVTTHAAGGVKGNRQQQKHNNNKKKEQTMSCRNMQRG